jgi:branched-chain amino acid transport system permease protein
MTIAAPTTIRPLQRGFRGRRVTGRGALVVLVVVVLLLVTALYPFNDLYTLLLTQAASFAVAALGLVILIGYSGQISLAQAVFFGIGAYALAIGVTTVHLEFWVAAVAGIALAALLGLLLGLVSLKVSGLHYLALVTIGVQTIFELWLLNQVNVTQGPQGIVNIPRAPLPGLSLDGDQAYLVFCLCLLCVLGSLVWWIGRMRIGRAMRAVRENPLAAEVIGIPTYRVKVEAFVLSAVFGAVGGILYTGAYAFISPDDFDLNHSIIFLLLTVLGGSGSVFGVTLGAVLVVFLPEWLEFLQNTYMAVYGLALILLMIAMPTGIWGGLRLIVGHWIKPARPPLPAVPPLTFRAPASKSEVMLAVRSLSMYFGGVKAVDGVDMEVRRGQVHALVGPNGSGKTTLLNVITGIYEPTAGDVLLDDRSITGLRPHVIASRGVSRTFQLIRLLRSESVLENVMVGAQVGRWAEQAHGGLTAQAMAALELVGLSSIAYEDAKNLPYGHQRLVEIARALASMPSLLLLDEPAAGLNDAEKQHLVELIARLRSESLTVVLIEHDMEIVRSVSDAVTVLNFGKAIAEGTCESILRERAVQEAYMGVVDVVA